MTTTSSPTTPFDQLTRALSATGELIAGVRDDQWAGPTGCPDWTVRRLVNHLVGGNLVFVALLREQAPPDRSADHLGQDPLGAFHAAGQELAAAFAPPGVLDRIYQAPPGPLPGLAALHLRITEALVHGWDLAQATGQPTHPLPEDLAETELALSQAQLADVPRTGHPFAPAQPVPQDAPALDRLVAYLGRPVPTTASDGVMAGGRVQVDGVLSFYVVFFTTCFGSLADAQQQAPQLLAEHVDTSTRLHGQGRLLMAGAFLDRPDEPLRTMAVLPSHEEARHYAEHDPFVRARLVDDWHIREWANIFA